MDYIFEETQNLEVFVKMYMHLVELCNSTTFSLLAPNILNNLIYWKNSTEVYINSILQGNGNKNNICK